MNEIGIKVDRKNSMASKTLESRPYLVLRTAARAFLINTYIKNTEKKGNGGNKEKKKVLSVHGIL